MHGTNRDMTPIRALAAFILAGTVLQDDKLPPPAAAEFKKAEAEIRSVFKDEFGKKDLESKRHLAQKLLVEGTDPKNGQVVRYAALVLARDLAGESLDFVTAFEAVDQMAGRYAVDKPPLAGASFDNPVIGHKAAALASGRKAAAGPEQLGALAEGYLALAQSALDAKQFDDALSAVQQSSRLAKDGSVAARAAQLGREIPDLKKESEEYARLVSGKIDDPSSRTTRGRHALFVRGDEKAGLASLAECSDSGLKSVARLELGAPASSEAFLSAADGWLDLSAKETSPLHKRRYRERAALWLERALKDAGGIAKAQIEQRLRELHKGVAVDLLRLIEPEGDWKKSGSALLMPAGDYAKIMVPYEVHGEYLIALTAQRTAGKSAFLLVLVVADKQAVLRFDAGAGDAEGGLAGAPETVFRRKVFDDGKPHTIVVDVKAALFSITVDGQTVAAWKSPRYETTAFNPRLTVRNPKSLVLGNYMSAYRVTKLELTHTSGFGRRVPTGP